MSTTDGQNLRKCFTNIPTDRKPKQLINVLNCVKIYKNISF